MHLVLPLQQLESSSVVNSTALRSDIAQARQGTQARSPAWVSPEMTRKGASSKLFFHCQFPCFSFAMTSKWSFSVGGGLTRCSATSLVSAFYSARLSGGNKDDGSGMDSLLDVACHDLPIALQDQQSHIDAGGVDRNELSRFQTGEHCLHMCTGCHEHRVEPLRTEGDRVAIRSENCCHVSRLRIRGSGSQ